MIYRHNDSEKKVKGKKECKIQKSGPECVGDGIAGFGHVGYVEKFYVLSWWAASLVTRNAKLKVNKKNSRITTALLSTLGEGTGKGHIKLTDLLQFMD